MEEIKRLLAENPVTVQIILAVLSIISLLLIKSGIDNLLAHRLNSTEKRYQIRKITAFISWFLIIFTITLIFNQRLGNFTVALGALSAGIAFSLQEIIVSFAGYLAITFGHFFKPGDRVELGRIKGDVIDVSLMRTTLMECGEWIKGDLYTGRIVRIANSFVFKEPVFNYSGNFPYLWDEITLPVKYGSDIRFTRKMLEKTAEEIIGKTAEEAKKAWLRLEGRYIIESSVTEPVVTLNLNDNWIEFTIRYPVDYKTRRSVRDKLYTRILEEVESNENKTAIASTTIQLVEPPVIKVKVQNDEKGEQEIAD